MSAKEKVKKQKKGRSDPDQRRFPKIVKKRQQINRGPNGGMQLLLIEDVEDLGKQGEVVEVRPGYGRNYLVPYGLATNPSPEMLARIDKHKAKLEALRLAKLADQKMLARQLEKVSVSIEANANDEGHLYGSVTAADIADALQAEKYNVTEEQVVLEGPLKELALYSVVVRLSDDVQAEVKVWVVPKGG